MSKYNLGKENRRRGLKVIIPRIKGRFCKDIPVWRQLAKAFVLGILVVGLTGCGHRALSTSTLNLASTVGELQYKQVLDNLAMLKECGYALPAHVRLSEGTMQVTDRVAPGITVTDSVGGNDARAYAGNASRQWQQSWKVAPVSDPDEIRALLNLYENVIIAESGAERENERKENNSENGATLTESVLDEEAFLFLGQERPRRVPTGWFSFSKIDNSPLTAKHGNTQVWLSGKPEHLKQFREFTLLTLKVTPESETAARTLQLFGRD